VKLLKVSSRTHKLSYVIEAHVLIVYLMEHASKYAGLSLNPKELATMLVTLPDKLMPPYYQKTDCQFVYRSLQAGESCSLIGIGSVGKSSLLQHLTQTVCPESRRNAYRAGEPQIMERYAR